MHVVRIQTLSITQGREVLTRHISEISGFHGQVLPYPNRV